MEVSFEPSERMKGFAVVSRKASPKVSMYNDRQKKRKFKTRLTASKDNLINLTKMLFLFVMQLSLTQGLKVLLSISPMLQALVRLLVDLVA